jgi:hypothetical protein
MAGIKSGSIVPEKVFSELDIPIAVNKKVK